jgi:hypothetical protein
MRRFEDHNHNRGHAFTDGKEDVGATWKMLVFHPGIFSNREQDIEIYSHEYCASYSYKYTKYQSDNNGSIQNQYKINIVSHPVETPYPS